MFLNIEKHNNKKIAAIDDKGNELSYGELVRCANDISNAVGRRNLVFILCHNRLAALAGYVGMMGSKNVPLLLSADIDSDLLKYLLETYCPNYIWYPCDKKDNFDFGNGDVLYKYMDYELITYNCDSITLYDELGLLLTTSGSTGSPKLVRQSYSNILSNATSIVEYLELDDTERPITMLPMNYTYGLSVINSHLLVGAKIMMTDSSYAQKPFWDFFKREAATSIVGVPFTYEILKKLRFFRMDLPSLRYMTQAGGKLLPELQKEYAQYAYENGKRFYVMYGQTEATARMSYLPYDKSLEKYGSMGIAIPGGEFSLVNEDGEVIDTPETVGELVYKGDNVTLGYAQCIADLSKGDERGGVLHTGDMAKRDVDGYYYIVGRKKRFLKIYGNRVNLDECERIIQGAFDNIECVCVGEDDHLRIFITDEDKVNDVMEFITMKTGLNAKAFEVIYITSIPKNDSGKKQYNML